MKRNFITALAVCYALSTVGLAGYAQENGYFNKGAAAQGTSQVVSTKASIEDNKKDITVKEEKVKEESGTDVHKEETSASSNSTNTNTTNNSTKKSVQAPLTRGAVTPSKNQGTSVSTKSTKVELLDWWKDAQFVFSRGTEAVVKDVYTGKTFKIVRTMGDNHADCEAATKQDTQIIKEIWGGFSWDRRPVQIIIGGRVLAASMAGMPHAGVDAAPAYDTVNNRAGGYGRGQNLDVIKGNGMDGHFDVHFLNSKTHGTSRVDPQHQACVKIAASK